MEQSVRPFFIYEMTMPEHHDLLNFLWIQNQLNSSNIQVLIHLYDEFLAQTPDEAVQLVRDALSVSRRILKAHPRTLAQQLAGRLMGYRESHPAIRTFIDGITPPKRTFFPVSVNTPYATHNSAGGMFLGRTDIHGDVRFLTPLTDETVCLYAGNQMAIVDKNGDVITRLQPIKLPPKHHMLGARELRNGDILGRSSYALFRWNRAGELLSKFETDDQLNHLKDTIELADGRIIGWYYADKKYTLWDSDGRSMRHITENHRTNISTMIQRSDDTLVIGYTNKEIQIFSPEGERYQVLRGHTDTVNGIIENPHDGRLLTWSNDKTLRFWSPDGEPLATLIGHECAVNGAFVRPDNTILSWGSLFGEIRIWSWDGDEIAQAQLSHSVDHCIGLKDGRFIVIIGFDGFEVWSADCTLQTPVHKYINSTMLIASTADNHLFSSDHIGLYRWSLDRPHNPIKRVHQSGITALYALTTGQVVTCSLDGLLVWWSWDGDLIRQIQLPKQLNHCYLLKDDRLITWGKLKHELMIWSAEGELLLQKPLPQLSGGIYSVKECANGDLVFVTTKHILYRFTRDGQYVVQMVGHEFHIYDVNELPDGTLVSWEHTGAGEPQFKLWLPTGEPAPMMNRDDIQRQLFSQIQLTPPTLLVHRAGSWIEGYRYYGKSRKHITRFYTDSTVNHFLAREDGERVVLGEMSGRVLFLRPIL